MYIDTHCHLTDERLKNKASEIVKNFKSNKIDFVINASSDIDSCLENSKMALKYNNVFCVVGLHPCEAKTYSEKDIFQIEEIYKTNYKVLGIGEIGLDYFYGKDDKKEQLNLFRIQLELACKLKAPVCLHVRDAYLDAFDMLKQYKNGLTKILFHCYSGSSEFLKQVINEFGEKAYFAFGGTSTFKNANKVVESIIECPINKIVFETDSPYLTPMPFRGKVDNEPKFVELVYKKVAQLKQIDEQELCKIVKQNVKDFFGSGLTC